MWPIPVPDMGLHLREFCSILDLLNQERPRAYCEQATCELFSGLLNAYSDVVELGTHTFAQNNRILCCYCVDQGRDAVKSQGPGIQRQRGDTNDPGSLHPMRVRPQVVCEYNQ